MTAPRRVDISSVIDAAQLSGLQIRVALILFCICLLDGFDTQVIAFVAPSISSDWGIPIARFGPIFSAGLLGSVVGSILLGVAADRIGRKIVILAALAAFALLTLACAFARSYEALLALRFLAGIGLGGVVPNLLAVASEYAPSRYRITMITMTLWGFPLGAAIGGTVIAALIRSHGWPIAFSIGGLLPLVLLPLFYLALPESIGFLTLRGRTPKAVANIMSKIDAGGKFVESDEFFLPEPEVGNTGIPALFRNGFLSGTVLLCTAQFFSLLTVYLLLNWIPSVLRQTGIPIQIAVMGTVVLNFAGIVGSLIFSRLVARFNALPIIAAGYLLGTTAVVTIGAVPPETAALMTAIFLTGFLIIGAQLSLSAYTAAYYPTQIRATGLGFAQGVGRTGSLLGPLLGGYLLSLHMEQESLFRFFAIPAAAVAICMMALYLIKR